MDKAEWRQLFKEVKFAWSLIKEEIAHSDNQGDKALQDEEDQKEENSQVIVSEDEAREEISPKSQQDSSRPPHLTKSNRQSIALERGKQDLKAKILKLADESEDLALDKKQAEPKQTNAVDFDLIAKDEQAFKDYLDRELRETYADLDDFQDLPLTDEEQPSVLTTAKPRLSKENLGQAIRYKEILDRPKGW